MALTPGPAARASPRSARQQQAAPRHGGNTQGAARRRARQYTTPEGSGVSPTADSATDNGPAPAGPWKAMSVDEQQRRLKTVPAHTSSDYRGGRRRGGRDVGAPTGYRIGGPRDTTWSGRRHIGGRIPAEGDDPNSG